MVNRRDPGTVLNIAFINSVVIPSNHKIALLGHMKTILLSTLLAVSSPSFADTVKEGNYVVVRGAVKGCEHSARLIFDVVKVEDSNPISILSIPDINVIGQSAQQIELKLEDKIEHRTGRRPTTLSINILQIERDYRNILTEYRLSLAHIERLDCSPLHKRRQQYRYLRNLDEQMEKIRLMELIDSFASGQLYDKALYPQIA